MNTSLDVLACDVGAGSGRILQCNYNGDALTIDEISRFSNGTVNVGECLYWDILSIYRNIRDGLLKASLQGIRAASLGIDTWGNDFALLDKSGLLIENPYSYRDQRTEGMLSYVGERIPGYNLYSRNGIQQVRMNSLYQLTSLARDRAYIFDHTEHFLFISDLLAYFLTGEKYCEYTLASISQLYNCVENDWDSSLMSLLDIPSTIFPPIIRPGVQVGSILPSACRDLAIGPIPLVSVGAHDTASAVAALPEPENEVIYISSGTWSIVGTEIEGPVINDISYKYNFSNEGGVENKTRLNKNVMGLWILQEVQRCFAAQGRYYAFDVMSSLAEKVEPFGPVIDPDNPCFYEPNDMPETIQLYCQATGQEVPETDGEIIRCVLESLALKYRYVMESLELVTNRVYDSIHIVGGGSRNKLLSQLTADCCKRPVFTGPAEATAIGNALVQLISLREISDIREARTLVKRSFPLGKYSPRSGDRWDGYYQHFLSVTGNLEL